SLLTEEQERRIQELQSLGARAEYKQVDVTNKEEVEYLFENIRKEYGNLNGILHSAGVIRDNFIIKKTKGELIEVLAPKVAGLVYLDEASKDQNLDFFVTFSSIASVLGNMGQADYSTANAFMDAYAGYRNRLVNSKQRHGETLSINWPLWKRGGMDVSESTQQMLKQNIGVIPMKSESGIQALYQSLVSTQNQVLVMEGNIKRIKKNMLNEVPSQQVSQSISYSKEQEYMQTVLLQITSKLLKVKIKEINVDIEWVDYGFDQFMLTNFVGTLNQEFHLELTPTVFLEYPTLHHLAKFLIDETGVKGKSLPMSTIGVDEVKREAVQYFKTLLSSVLRVPVNHIEADIPFEKYGIDSIMVMQLTNQLEKTFGSLPKTLFFEYQNIQDLTE
ncbi:beta-ketoacyl reductase, partial [Priestia megaterium]|uniref:beta-ketoacyl reductase n=1 Tax=Priestia megaterium TaxID=1404 RepID=UPI0012D9A4D7